MDVIIERLQSQYPELTIVSGGEPTGVDDVVAQQCAVVRGYHECMSDEDQLPVDQHAALMHHFAEFLPADKSARAKFARNSKIVQHSQMLIALFADGPWSPGTTDTVNKALKAGLPIHVHHEGTWIRP